jgi:hypothetical protein
MERLQGLSVAKQTGDLCSAVWKLEARKPNPGSWLAPWKDVIRCCLLEESLEKSNATNRFILVDEYRAKRTILPLQSQKMPLGVVMENELARASDANE